MADSSCLHDGGTTEHRQEVTRNGELLYILVITYCAKCGEEISRDKE